MAKNWFASFEMDAGNQICRSLTGPYPTTQATAVYAVLISRVEKDGYMPRRIPCGYRDLCWWDGEWFCTHYDWTDGEPVEIEITDRQTRNEYAYYAEALHDDVLRTAEENGIDPDDIEWEDNPYDETDPDDFYFCEWESDGEQPDEDED